MKPIIFISKVFFVFVILSNIAYASGDFDITIKGQSITIKNNATKKTINLPYEIFGYETNCSKKTVITWGKPKILNKSNPQESFLTVIRLDSPEKPLKIGFSKNIYGVTFLDDGLRALIDTDTEAVINLNNGKTVETNGDSTDLITPETCINFENKSFKKFKD